MSESLSANDFRYVLGQYPTGVVVVTALSPAGEAIGMTVGSFTSVSLNPPLVAFLPDKGSSSWRTLREAGTSFGVNVLAADQENVCRQVATRKSDKFDGLSWRRSDLGNPIIAGCLAFIDCETHSIFDAGDHDIVVGEVSAVTVERRTHPLLFFRGGYGSFHPTSLAAGAVGLRDELRYIDAARPEMERLADDADCEVTALLLVDGDLVQAACAGRTKPFLGPSRVGQRAPFMPPIGAVHAAWGGDEVEQQWLDQVRGEAGPEETRRFRRMLQQIRERGYGFTVGHEIGTAIEVMAMRQSYDHRAVSNDDFRHVVRAASDYYNIEDIDPDVDYEFHAATAPVFHPDGRLAFTLTIWGPSGRLAYAAMTAKIERLLACARNSTAALASRGR